jgi:hypothetical protein
MWQTHRPAMEWAYARHDALLREAMTAHRGVVYKLIRRHRESPQYGLPDARRIG